MGLDERGESAHSTRTPCSRFPLPKNAAMVESANREFDGTLQENCGVDFWLPFPLNCVPKNPSPKAARGVVSRRISGCDYFIVATKSAYDVLEWYVGHDPDKGDMLIGG
jgi:hypothetical protein